MHYLIPGGGLSCDGRTWVAARAGFLLHHRALGARVRTLYRGRLRKDHPQLFAQVPAKVWKASWNVGCQAAGSGQNALRYLSRYIFKTATGNRSIPVQSGGRLLWIYRHNKTRKLTSVSLEPLEWVRRFLQHVLPRHFARVRTFGWLHPAAKVRLNRVRALLRQAPQLTSAEQRAWLLVEPSPAQSTTETAEQTTQTSRAPCCPRCRIAMRWLASWQPGQPIPLPLRPKRPP